MLKRPFWMVAAFGSAALCAALQLRVNYRDQDFTLSGFDKFSATLETNSVAFQGSGAPLHIESKSEGLTLTGTSAVGTAERGADRAYFLKDLTISGNAHATVDSATATKAAPPGQTNLTDVVSESMHFTGTSESGRIEFATQATIDSKATGTRTTKGNPATPFQRTLHLTGSKGFVTLLLGGKQTGGLQAGELSGPVNFTINDQAGTGTTGATTLIEGSGDQLTFSVGAEPRTITLQGNVKATGKSDVFTGDLSADSMVVTLGADLQPSKIEIKGNPAKTHGVSLDGKGGGG